MKALAAHRRVAGDGPGPAIEPTPAASRTPGSAPSPSPSSAPCWLALHLPALSLEAFLATLPADERGAPLALLDGGRIGMATAAARGLGVRPGQTRATALALAPSLRLGLADALRDAQAREAVAHTALRFTPAVSWDDAATLLLEVAATLRLWGGLERLLQRLRDELALLGHRAVVACAPTPLGAVLLARGFHGATGAVVNPSSAASDPRDPAGLASALPAWLMVPPVFDMATLRKRLDRLPLQVPAQRVGAVAEPVGGRTRPAAQAVGEARADETLEALIGMGLRTLGDLRALPRAGLARRFGTGWLALLDRARGEAPDPREPLRPPETFETRIELFTRADLGVQVAEGARVLLLRLVAWAQARQGRVECFTLVMRHEPRHRHDVSAPEATVLELSLAEPSNDVAHLGLLLRERLARLALPAPTLELALRGARLVQAAPPQASLFPTPACARTNLMRLLERLQARLGADGVLQLQPAPDHRPERATRLIPAEPGRLASGSAARPRLTVASGVELATRTAGTTCVAEATGITEATGAIGAIGGTEAPSITRPAWLLPEPQPLPQPQRHSLGPAAAERPWLDGRPLRLLCGPERIEAGWWDGDPVARDYFIAVDAEGALLWVFRQRLQAPTPASAPVHWFLHGWFG